MYAYNFNIENCWIIYHVLSKIFFSVYNTWNTQKGYKKKCDKEDQLPKANTGVAKSFLLIIFLINIFGFYIEFVFSTLF